MTGHEEGTRVVAVRNGNKDAVYIFGYGTYVGNRRLPPEMPSIFGTNEESMRKIMTQEYLGKPKQSISEILDRSRMTEPAHIAEYDAAIEREETEKAAGTFVYSEKDIETMIDRSRRNPCIELDSGEIVWGCECWWGPEEDFKKSIGDKPVEVVSLQDFRREVREAAATRQLEPEQDGDQQPKTES